MRSEELLTSHRSLLTCSPIALQFACNPSGIAFRGSDDRCGNDFRNLVRMERPDSRLKAGIRLGAGLEHAKPFRGFFYGPLPAVDTGNWTADLNTGSKPLGNRGLRDTARNLG